MNILALLALAKKYTDESIEGTTGALAGKNCTIDSITAITGGNRITFKWTGDDGTENTDTLDVMDGVDGADGQTGATGATGKGIKSVAVNGSNHLIVTYTDDQEVDAGEIDVSSKATKVSGATSGHLASLTSGGDLQDSGKAVADFVQNADLQEKTIYVDYVNGSDSKDGSTAEDAVKTVAGALALCLASEKITLIFTSNYTDDISISSKYATLFMQSADSENPITIAGLVGIQYIPSVVITDIVFTGSSSSQVVSLSHTRAIIKGCSITNTSTSGNAFALTVSNCSAEIRNCSVTGRRAIQVSGASPVIIRAESGKTCSITATLDYLFSGMASQVFIQKQIGTVNITFPTAYADNTGGRKAIYVFEDNKIVYGGLANKVDSATEGNLASLTSSGDLADSGKKAGDFVAKAELPAVTVYVDYANGSDTKDGLTQATALKTVDEAFDRVSVNTFLTIILCSDYTGDITNSNSLVACVKITSVDTEHPVTINGIVKISYKTYVYLTYVNVLSEITSSLTEAVYFTSCSRVLIQDVDIAVKNTYQNQKGYGIRLNTCANTYIYQNVNVHTTNDSTKTMHSSYVVYGGFICNLESNNTTSGAYRVMSLYNGAIASLRSDFVNVAQCMASEKINLGNSGAVYFLDGVLQNQPIPECPTTTDGTFVLKATVSSGAVTYSWVAES